MYSKKTTDWKGLLKDRFLTALTVAPSLGVMLLSAIYQLTFGGDALSLSRGLPLLLGWLSLLSFAATTVLALVYRRRFVTVLLSLLFVLAFVCYLGFYLSGTTDLVSDGFFELLMLVFSLPLWSYMSVAVSIAKASAVPSLVITALLAVLNVAATAFVCVAEKKEKTTRGR